MYDIGLAKKISRLYSRWGHEIVYLTIPVSFALQIELKFRNFGLLENNSINCAIFGFRVRSL